jgi:RND family efflux transporter MFP subunit
MKKVLLPALLAVGVSLFSACGKDDASPAQTAAPLKVDTLRLTRAPVARLCEVPGTVVNRDQAVVAARIMGTVARADFTIGQEVRKGQVLVTLSAPEMVARVDQAQAALDKASRDYERENGLLSSGATTGQTVRDMAERLRIAQAALDEARSLNSYTSVTAPFDGRILSKTINAGDLAAPGMPLFEIAGTQGLRVEATIPDTFPDAPTGSTITIRAGDIEYAATLAEHSPAADTMTRTRLVKLDLPAATPLRSGQFVRLLWPVGERSDLLVPASALSQRGQLERVYVLEEGSAKMRIVKTGEAHGASLQVLSGLDDGDTVLIDPPASIQNGQKVEGR